MASHIRTPRVMLAVIFIVFLCNACLAGTVAEANLVSWWKLDDSGTTATDSAGSNHGSVNGATWTTGKIGGALDFDGVDDYVQIPDDDSLTPTHRITISYWVYNRGGKDAGIFKYATCTDESGSPGNSRAYGLRIESDISKVRFLIHSSVSASDKLDSDNTVSTNGWHHIAATFDQGQAKIYVDGVPDGSKTMSVSTIMNDAQPLIFGGNWSYCDNETFNQKLNGILDDVRIYDKALSPEEIEELYQEAFTGKACAPNPPDGADGVDPNVILTWAPGLYADSHDVYLGTDFDDVNDANNSSPEFMGNFDVNSYDPCGFDIMTTYYWRVDEINDTNLWKGDVWSFRTVDVNLGLVSLWKFDEGSGDTAFDSAGSNHGNINGATWTTGKIGGALDFDGIDDYVLVNDDDSLDFGAGDSFSFCLWLRYSTADTARTMKYSSTSENGYGLFINLPSGSVGRISFRTWSGGQVVITEHTGGYNDSEWHLVCGVRDQSAGMVRLYVDGSLKDEMPENARDLSNSGDLVIGSENSLYANFYEGLMDDVRIYNRALFAEEIEELYRWSLSWASNPNPQNGQTSVDPNAILTWSPGLYADSHDVYLGTGFNDVNDANNSSPEFRGNFDVNSYDPCGLELSTVYYWRVDEINDTSVWKGDVWSFKTSTPLIELSSDSIIFRSKQGVTPASQTLGISNSGAGVLNWTIIADCNWLKVDPSGGSSTGEVDDVNISVDINGLSSNIYTGELIVSDPNADNSPQLVEVVFIYGNIIAVPYDYVTIQEAINNAVDGNEVVIAPGTYTGSGNRDIDFLGKAITVRSIDQNDPNIVANTVVDCQNTYGHRGFIFQNGEGYNSIIDGLTIMRGNIAGNPARGGGVYCVSASPTIKNSVIKNNKAVGDNDFSGGDGKEAYGGGIYVESGIITLHACNVLGNQAKGGYSEYACGGHAYGGGIYIESDSAIITDCNISNNSVIGGKAEWMSSCGSGGIAYGGGIYGSANIYNSFLTHNRATGGDGYTMKGGAIAGAAYGELVLRNCQVSYNLAKLFDFDTGVDLGPAGLYLKTGSEVTNCIIADNQCLNGIAYPIAVHCSGSSIISNCTIANNTVDYTIVSGPAVRLEGQCSNSVFANNTNSFDVEGGTVTYCCTEQSVAGIGNIIADPYFISGSKGDYYLSQIAAGQAVDSPCVDAGSDSAYNLLMDASTTRTDEVRDVNIVDMGYHYEIPNPADFDEDGNLDLADFAVVAAQWLSTPGTPSADIEPLNGDGIVDELDLDFLCRYWLGK